MGVSFNFSLGQNVVIEDIGINGKVDALMIDRDSIQWADVRYVTGQQEIKRKWFREADLAALGTETGADPAPAE